MPCSSCTFYGLAQHDEAEEQVKTTCHAFCGCRTTAYIQNLRMMLGQSQVVQLSGKPTRIDIGNIGSIVAPQVQSVICQVV